MLQRCGKLQARAGRKNCGGSVEGEGGTGKVYWLGSLPPLPLPSESRDWRGVCKRCLQNLEPQGVRGQNLENKALGSGRSLFTHGYAGAYLASLQIPAQGWMSHR